MKRIFAVLLILCSLLSVLPMALAAPEDEAPAEAAGEEVPQEETEELPEQKPEKKPEKPREEAQKPDDNLLALSSETAIHRMEVRVKVDGDGYASVTETIELHILGTLEEIRFSFPAGAKKCDIMGYWTKSSNENGLRYLTIKDRKGFSGTQKFTLTYNIQGTIEGGEASQILSLPLLSFQDYKIGYFIFEVTMPNNFSGKPYFSSGYYGELVEEFMTVVNDGLVITGTVDDIIRDNDDLMLFHVLPEHYFAGSYGESRLSPVMAALVMVILLFTLFYWYRTLRNPSLRVNARSLPPDGVTPGDLPYLLSGGQADFNMLLTHWAVLGYLSFYVNKGGTVVMQRHMDMGNERRAFERRLFELLFAESDEIDCANVRFRKVGAKAVEIIPRYWAKRLYDKRSGSVRLAHGLSELVCALATLLAMDAVAPAKGHFLYLILGLIAGAAMGVLIIRACGAYYMNRRIWVGLGIACGIALLVVGGLGGATYVMLPSVALTIFIGWQTAHGGMRKGYGDEVISQTLGFRRFMHNANEDHIQQMQRRDPQYFYKILPYAEAMGQGKKFAELFRGAKLEPCQWYESAREVPNTAQAFYNRYTDMLDLLNISLKK